MSVAQTAMQDLAFPLSDIAERMRERLCLAQSMTDDEALAASAQAFAQVDAACNAVLEEGAARLAMQHHNVAGGRRS